MTSTSSVYSAIPGLPNAVVENIIFSKLSLTSLGACSRVCKAWREMAKKQINAFAHVKAFGPKEWFTYFGVYLRNVPRLPSNITEILNSPCPFWPDKKVHETHLLVLVPQTLNAQPFMLKNLGELVKNPLQGYATQYRYFFLGEYTDLPAATSRWVLMTRDVIEGSRNKSYRDQQALIEKHVIYEVPHLLDATVCIFMEYVRTGIRLYSNNPWTFTSCQEKYDFKSQFVVGGFGSEGLGVTIDEITYDEEEKGVGGCRKF